MVGKAQKSTEEIIQVETKIPEKHEQEEIVKSTTIEQEKLIDSISDVILEVKTGLQEVVDETIKSKLEILPQVSDYQTPQVIEEEKPKPKSVSISFANESINRETFEEKVNTLETHNFESFKDKMTGSEVEDKSDLISESSLKKDELNILEAKEAITAVSETSEQIKTVEDLSESVNYFKENYVTVDAPTAKSETIDIDNSIVSNLSHTSGDSFEDIYKSLQKQISSEIKSETDYVRIDSSERESEEKVMEHINLIDDKRSEQEQIVEQIIREEISEEKSQHEEEFEEDSLFIESVIDSITSKIEKNTVDEIVSNSLDEVIINYGNVIKGSKQTVEEEKQTAREVSSLEADDYIIIDKTSEDSQQVPKAEIKQVRHKGKPPRFIQRLVNQDFYENENLHLDCYVEGEEPIQVEWLFNDQRIESLHDRNVEIYRELGVCSLEIFSSNSKYQGEYRCHATNVHGFDRTACFLNMINLSKRSRLEEPERAGKVEFIEPLKDQAVELESKAFLDCSVKNIRKSDRIEW